MPILAHTGPTRTGTRKSSNRSKSTGHGGNFNRVSSEKAFVPPGRVKPPQQQTYIEDRPMERERSVIKRPELFTGKAFIPSGSIKYAPPPYEMPNPSTVVRSPARRSDGHTQALDPFVPSGAVKSQLSSPPRADYSGGLDYSDLPRPATTTEYEQQYRQWALPHRDTAPADRHLSPLSTYQINLSAANWESEQHKAFKAHPAQVRAPAIEDTRSAGLPSSRMPMPLELSAPASRIPKVVPAPSPNRLSEHVSEFLWPQPAAAGQPSNAAKQTWAPMPADPSLSDIKWKSEYNENYHRKEMEVGRLRKDGRQEAQALFYAEHELDRSTELPPPPPPRAPYQMGNSEYKSKYPEWPAESMAHPEHSSSSMLQSSRVLPAPEPDAYDQHRLASEYRNSYTLKTSEHDLPAPRQREVSPMVFAWPDQKPAPVLTKTGPVQDGTTEYSRRFQWPADHQQTTEIRPIASENLNLFDPAQAHHLGAVDSSEYRRQYIDKEVHSPSRMRPKSGDYPVQFAWPTDIREETEKRKYRHTLEADDSEAHAKYQWPKGSALQRTQPQKDVELGPKIGQVFALDADTGDQWKSEYEREYENLRNKTRQNLNQIAGVASASRPAIPSFYAWSDENPRPAPVKRAPADPEHFRTEHGDQFLAFKTIPDLPFAGGSNTAIKTPDNLNLFHANGTVARSEYAEKFQGLAGGAEVQFKHAVEKDIPSQFAWPAPPRPPTPPRSTVPMEKTEYDTRYTWPAATAPTVAIVPVRAEDHVNALLHMPQDTEPKATKSAVKAPPAVAAGLVVVKDEDMPAFFAWAEAEAKKTPSAPRQRSTGDATSEYEDQFRSRRPVPVVMPGVVPERSAAIDHIASQGIIDSGDRIAPVTEYEARFQKFSVSAVHENFKEKVARQQADRPSQFAWSLTPQQAVLPPPPRPTVPFAGASEYDSCFRPPPPPSAPQAVEVVKTNPLGLAAEASSVSAWKSEYDARYASGHSENMHRAGVTSIEGASAPSFFAWQPPVPVVEARATPKGPRATETSEYADKFTSSRPQTAPQRKPDNTFEHFEFGGRRALQGISEYDNQFSSKESAEHGHGAKIAERMRFTQSLSTTNLDPAYADSVIEQTNRSKRTAPHAKHEVSEASAAFQWPADSAATQPTLASHRSKVVLGGNIPHTLRGDNKENNPALANTTEAQDKFSWPNATVNKDAQVKKVMSKPGFRPDRSYLYRPHGKDLLLAKKAYDHHGNCCPVPRGMDGHQTIGQDSICSADSLAQPSATTSGSVRPSTHTSQSSVPSTASRAEGSARVAPHSPPARQLGHALTCTPTRERAVIPGLREPRSRSVPPRRVNAYSPAAKQCADDSNPLLLNRRYPSVSNKQSTRWATEAMDSFKWKTRQTSGPKRRSLSPQ